MTGCASKDIVTLLADSSVARKFNTLFRIADLVNRLREAAGLPIRLAVPALAHAEVIAYLRREKGPSFDPELVDSTLRSKEIDVVPLDRLAAEDSGNHLYRWFQTHAAWNANKRGGDTRRGANVDWYIAAHSASHAQGVLIVDDTGLEFKQVETLARSSDILHRLEGLLIEAGI